MTLIEQRSIMVAMFWLAMALALFMALVPKPPALPGNLGDKVQHILGFATLTALAVLAYRPSRYLTLFGSLAIFGACVELAQAIPALQRDADIRDWLADSAAILVVLCFCQALRHRSRLKMNRVPVAKK